MRRWGRPKHQSMIGLRASVIFTACVLSRFQAAWCAEWEYAFVHELFNDRRKVRSRSADRYDGCPLTLLPIDRGNDPSG